MPVGLVRRRRDKELVELEMSALVAGAKYRGEFEDRLKSVVKEVAKSNGQIILFIDELHTIVGAGASEGSMDAGNILKPALARGELRAIGATTLDEYRKYIEKDAALARRFQTVLVSEPSVEDTISILRGLKEKYEQHHRVRITDSALVAAADLVFGEHDFVAEALAFIFAFTFNVPCAASCSMTVAEAHSPKWVAVTVAFYICASLLLGCAAYHVGLLLFG